MDDVDSVLAALSASAERLRRSGAFGDRGGSRYIGEGAHPDAIRTVADGGELPVDRRGLRKALADGDRLTTEPTPLGLGGRSTGLAVLRDVRALHRGDVGAWSRLERSAKAVIGGEVMVRPTTLPGYIEASAKAAPVRGLASEFEVDSGEVRMLLEGEPVEPDWTPMGGLKPPSDAAVLLKLATVHKCAGTTTVPDELLDDSRGLAERLVSESFGRQIGRKVDQALLDGDGVGKPLGVLRTPGVNREPVGGQTAVDLFDAIIAAVVRLRAKGWEPSAVVLRPEVAATMDTARTSGSGSFLFDGDWRDRLDVRVVYAPNLPVVDGEASIVVADWRSAVYVLSRGGLVIESSPYPAFEEDSTTYRCFERVGGAVVKADAVEIVDGVEIDEAETPEEPE